MFDIPNEIRVSYDESYQELFNNSSVLVTDYSSVFFDFAYLKKPVIYYHPIDDYHYENSYFDYETMGFGDVVKFVKCLFSYNQKTYLTKSSMFFDMINLYIN